MSVTLRSTSVGGVTAKGSPLTYAELDNNFLFTQFGTGAATQTVQEKERQVVNAADFGTKLATTPGADINLAITAINAAGGGVVVVKPGSYTIETPILHKSNVELFMYGATLTAGTGLNNPVIKNATDISSKSVSGITNSGRTATVTTGAAHGYSAGDWVHISGASPEGYNGWHKIISAPLSTTFTYYVDKNIAADSGTITCHTVVESNLRLRGGKIVGNASNTVGDNFGIHYDGVRDFEITDVVVDGTDDTCIQIRSAVRGRIFRCRADNAIQSTQNGIVLGATSPDNRYCDDVEVVACEANHNGQTGIIAQLGYGVRIVASGAQYNAVAGVKVAGSSNVSVVGCWGKYNEGAGFQIQGAGGNKNIICSSGEFVENGEPGILVGQLDTSNPMTNVSLIGNQCHRNGQIAAPSFPYGIAFEPASSATISRVNIIGNQCDDQTRGLSFGTNGTISNVTIVGNRGVGNTVDISFGSALDLTTLEYGYNSFPDFTDGFSWTPVLTFATPGDLSVVYSQQHGRYWKNEKEVTIWVNILTSTFTHTTASGNLQITGLPFTALNVSNFTQLGGGLGWRGITKANYTDINPFITANTAIINFAASGSGQALAVIAPADMPTGGTVQLTFQMKIRIP